MALTIIEQKQAELKALEEKAAELMINPDWTKEERRTASETNASIALLKDELKMRGASTMSGFTHPNPPEDKEADVAGHDYKKSYGFGPKAYNVLDSNSYKTAFREYMTKHGELANVSPGSLKTLQEGSDQQGGFLVPMDYQAEIIEKMPGMTTAYSKTQKVPCSSNLHVQNKVPYPTDNIYTSSIRLFNAGEVLPNSSVALATTPTIQQISIPVYTWTGNIPVSLNLVEDSENNIVDYLSGQFANAAALAKDQLILLGTGDNSPIGIVSLSAGAIGSLTEIPTLSIDHTSTTAFPDAIMKMPFVVPPQYDLSRMAYVLSKTNTGSYIAGLKDLQDRYLFGQGYQDSGLSAGRPTTLAGYDIVWDEFMEASTSSGSLVVGNRPLVFGDFSGYCSVERVGFSVRVLDQPYYAQNQLQVVSRFRFGGAPTEEWKFVVGAIS